MIKVYDNSNPVQLFFPKHIVDGLDEYTVTLKSNLTNEVYEYDGLEDIGDGYDNYKFSLDLSALNDGEYTYNVSGLSTGLLSIGKYRKEKQEKEHKNNKPSKQYIYG